MKRIVGFGRIVLALVFSFGCLTQLPVKPVDGGSPLIDAGSPSVEADSGADAEADAGAVADAGSADAASDSGADAEADAGTDVGLDAGVVVPVDAGPWRYHAGGWASPAVHGAEAKKGLRDCQMCHGQALTGLLGPSCDTCHGGWKTNCTFCHGGTDNTSGAPPADSTGKSASTEVSVGAHTAHVSARSGISAPIDCSSCHVKPTDALSPGHIDPGPAEVTLARGGSWNRASATCQNAYCHGAFDGGNGANAPVWTSGAPATCGSCHSIPPPPPHTSASPCSTCHGDVINASFVFVNPALHANGVVNLSFAPGSCSNACHEIPPATGSHLVHYGAQVAQAGYGDTATTDTLLPDGGGYAFGCGNCHPTDNARHFNRASNGGGGVAEVDLSPATAPDGSVKSRNAPTAAYSPGGSLATDSRGMAYTTGGTCSGVYCHSRPEVSAPGPIPSPSYTDGGYPFWYAPYAVSVSRSYSTPTWGGSSLGCAGCHGFPPRTAYPAVVGGVGDSHSYIDQSGEENLHAAEHSFEPIACATCHYGTVKAQGVRSVQLNTDAGRYWSVYQAVPIANRARHVNGRADVAFTPDPVPTGAWVMSPATFYLADGGASFTAETKTCSNVGCHLEQTAVKWGLPYRSAECNVCHRY